MHVHVGAQVTHTRARAQHDGVRSRVAALLARRCAAPLSVSPPRIRAVANRVASQPPLGKQRRGWRRPQRVASRRGQAGGGGDGSSRPRRAARSHALTYCWTIGRRHDQSTLDDRRVESGVLYISLYTLIAVLKAKTASLSSIPGRNSASFALSSHQTRSCPLSATAIAGSMEKQGFVRFSRAFVGNVIDTIKA